eukprot:4026712-Amphidinium_carterae.1
MPEEVRKRYVTVTGEGLSITGWKETTLIIGNLIMQVKFIVANVQSPLIGLSDMDYNEIIMHTGTEPTIEQHGYYESAMKIGSHLYVAAMVLPGLHNYEEVRIDQAVQTRYDVHDQRSLIIDEIEELSTQAYVQKQLRQPHQPTTLEIQEHRLTNMPYRSWCPICVKAKGQPNHHRKGALKEQSLIQLDYAYMKSTSSNK